MTQQQQIQMPFMNLPVIKEKNDFTDLLHHYFFFSVEQEKGNVLPDNHVKQKYYDANREKIKIQYNQNWSDFLESIKKIKLIKRFRVDIHSSMHSIKIICTLNSCGTNGIGVYLSWLGNLYTFYFISNQNPSNAPYFAIEFNTYLTYVPLNDKQRLASEEMESMLNKYFPSFSRFNNDFAEIPINDIQTFYSFEKKTSLFKVLFNNYSGGIFF